MQNSRCATTCSPLLETLTASHVTRALKGLRTPEQRVTITGGQCSALHRPWEGADAQLQGQKEPWLSKTVWERVTQPAVMYVASAPSLPALFYHLFSVEKSQTCSMQHSQAQWKAIQCKPPALQGARHQL